jgi:hypothetical protein
VTRFWNSVLFLFFISLLTFFFEIPRICNRWSRFSLFLPCKLLWNLLTPIIYPCIFTSKGETCSKWALSSQVQYSTSSCTFPLSLSLSVEWSWCLGGSLCFFMGYDESKMANSICFLRRSVEALDYGQPSTTFLLHTFLSTCRSF